MPADPVVGAGSDDAGIGSTGAAPGVGPELMCSRGDAASGGTSESVVGGVAGASEPGRSAAPARGRSGA